MADLNNLFPQWGDDGVFPSSGFFYEGGDQVSDNNFNALWNGVQEQNAQLITGVRDRIRDAVGDVVLNGGLVVSQGTNARDVDVTASDGAYVDGQKVGSVSATTLTLSAGGPRTDSVYLTTGGTLGLAESTTTVANNHMKVAEVDLDSTDAITAIRNVANDLQFDYVTETQPSGASAGDTWLDLSTNRVKAYQNGGFRTLITEQDSITVSGGDGLSGGGSVNLLGGSTSLDVNVSDIAGTHLSDDGSNNLTVDDDFVSNTGDTMSGDLTLLDGPKIVFTNTGKVGAGSDMVINSDAGNSGFGDVRLQVFENDRLLIENGGDVLVDGSRILTTADEGSGNGLDADTVDGQEASDLGSAKSYTLVDTASSGTFVEELTINFSSGSEFVVLMDNVETSDGGLVARLNNQTNQDYRYFSKDAFGIGGNTSDGNEFQICETGTGGGISGEFVISESDTDVHFVNKSITANEYDMNIIERGTYVGGNSANSLSFTGRNLGDDISGTIKVYEISYQ